MMGVPHFRGGAAERYARPGESATTGLKWESGPNQSIGQ